MSASERLKALDDATPRFDEDGFGWSMGDLWSYYLSPDEDHFVVALRNALPELIAVVEAAERHEAKKLLPNNETLWALEQALAALDAKVTGE